MSYGSKKLKSPTERATALIREHEANPSWRQLSAKYGVPAGTLCRFAKSGGTYLPRHYLDALEIDAPVMVPAPACRQCGQVHVRSKCTVRKPLPEWVTRVADLLEQRETKQPRLYGRGGRKV